MAVSTSPRSTPSSIVFIARNTDHRWRRAIGRDSSGAKTSCSRSWTTMAFRGTIITLNTRLSSLHNIALIDGDIEESGLNSFLALLSICVTCKYKGVSFLRFLLSRDKDINDFAQGRSAKRKGHRLDLYPKGYPSGRNRQPRLTRVGSRDLAFDVGVGHLYDELIAGLREASLEMHPTVVGVAFIGKLGKRQSRLTIITLQLKSSDLGNGLSYTVCLDRCATYFGTGKAKMRSVFPAYQRLTKQNRAVGECGEGRFTAQRTWKCSSRQSHVGTMLCQTLAMRKGKCPRTTHGGPK